MQWHHFGSLIERAFILTLYRSIGRGVLIEPSFLSGIRRINQTSSGDDILSVGYQQR